MPSLANRRRMLVSVVGTAWYDVPTATLAVLEQGFIQRVLLSFADAEVRNMVIGAMMKRKARTEGKAEGIAEGKERGIAIGKERGIAIGKERGIAIGEERGIAIGEERGIAIGEERGIAIGKERGIAKGEERGIARGKAEMNAEWRAWLHRKSEAEANGAVFSEPPPDAR